MKPVVKHLHECSQRKCKEPSTHEVSGRELPHVRFTVCHRHIGWAKQEVNRIENS